MGYLYHGSSQSGIKRLEPHKSTHGSYVYATPYKELTVIFSGKAGDDMTYSLFRNSNNEPWQVVERIPNGFETMFNNESSIYTLSDATFKDIKTGFAEVVSETSVDIISEEKIENVYQKLKELNSSGLIKLYHYPDRPNNIPLDDSDLINKVLNQAEREKKSITHTTFERLLLLHPNLLEKVNTVACLKNEGFVPFKKEDLIDIFEKYVLMQMIYPSKEQFIKSSFISLTEMYPELLPILKGKIEIFDKPKEEKISYLIDSLSKSVKNVSIELIKNEKMRYIKDSRTFSEIGQEILDIYKRISLMENIVNRPINNDVLNNSIILIGPMGSGKSTVGHLLSAKLNMPHISLDNREQLNSLYQQSEQFKSFKDFEFYLTSTVLTNLDEPTIIDFGAGHSIYENQLLFIEIQKLIQQFSNVVLLMPSNNLDESLDILRQRKGIEKGSDRDNDNKHFLTSSCNYNLATYTQYTKGKIPEQITNELIDKIYQNKDYNTVNTTKM